MIRLGVSSYTFSQFEGNSSLGPRKYSIEKMFQIAKEMRVNGIEVDNVLMLNHFNKIKENSEKFQVKVLGGCDGILEYGGTHNVAEFKNLCVRIRNLGGTYVSSMIEDNPCKGRGLAQVITRKNLAEHERISYFLETHRHTITENPDTTRLIADALPDLMFNADLSHWIVQGYPLKDIIWIFPRVKHVHVRVACEDNVQVEVGNGKSKEIKHFMEEIIEPILRRRFEGILVAELIPQLLSNQKYYPVDDTFNLLRELRKTMRRTWETPVTIHRSRSSVKRFQNLGQVV
jgi:sugar phosphate isomerase/epimerase